MKTTEQYNADETKKIVEALDEYVWFDMPTDLQIGIRAKSGQVMTALIYVLVEKGLISASDVKRITNPGRTQD